MGRKSTKENTKDGVKYESVMTELNARLEQEANALKYNYTTSDNIEQKMNEDYEENFFNINCIIDIFFNSLEAI